MFPSKKISWWLSARYHCLFIPRRPRTVARPTAMTVAPLSRPGPATGHLHNSLHLRSAQYFSLSLCKLSFSPRITCLAEITLSGDWFHPMALHEPNTSPSWCSPTAILASLSSMVSLFAGRLTF
ncbi:hypothetical protein JAAARDRAFT_578521 [Jaapia argillacea MUCL 33604]|uniref:Uncharacterized protein n=1 Tax=Jaapia argillacea MUCL 33604 TaxID=933084 RepID=A0A067Q2K5_9AGAM|nr:hypothetical protein JAAARDRAFT_578521 [Jaapia argillacea MUCL 33604]